MGRLISSLCNYITCPVPLAMVNVVISCSSTIPLCVWEVSSGAALSAPWLAAWWWAVTRHLAISHLCCAVCLYKLLDCLWSKQEWIKAENRDWYFSLCARAIFWIFFSQHTLPNDVTLLSVEVNCLLSCGLMRTNSRYLNSYQYPTVTFWIDITKTGGWHKLNNTKTFSLSCKQTLLPRIWCLLEYSSDNCNYALTVIILVQIYCPDSQYSICFNDYEWVLQSWHKLPLM